jgi:uncharacterized protein DUF3971
MNPSHARARHPRSMRARVKSLIDDLRHEASLARRALRRWYDQALRLALYTRSGRLSRRKAISLGVVFIAVVAVLALRSTLFGDVAAPFIARALEEKLGPGHRVEIGSSKLERNALGETVLQVHDIVVHGPDGQVIARAPRAEVDFEGGFLTGRLQARRIDLIGAEMTVLLGGDGRIAVTAAPNGVPRITLPKSETPPTRTPVGDPFRFPELARWLDGLERSGLDGIALAEVGLKHGTLVVVNLASGRRWRFSDTDIRLARPHEGGVTLSVSSATAGKPWRLTATIGAKQDGVRAIDVVASALDPGDLLLAAGFGHRDFYAEPQLSGIFRARVAEDGSVLSALLQVQVGRGMIGKASDSEARFFLNDALLQASLSADRKSVVVDPILFNAGANRVGLQATVRAPTAGEGVWPIEISQGLVALSGGREEAPLVLERISVRGHYDPRAERLAIENGDISGMTVGIAFSGALTMGGPRPMLMLGLAGARMPLSAFKRLWPVPIAAKTRAWVMERVEQGLIERAQIAVNVPLDTIGQGDVELPDQAVRVDLTASNVAFRPTANLPLVRDAPVTVTVTGRTARVRVPKAVVETAGSRRITLSDGELVVPNHAPATPKGNVRFRFEGPADALAEVLSMEPLRTITGFTFDAASTRGTATGNVRVETVFRRGVTAEEIDYSGDGELVNFTADRMVRGQRVEGINAKIAITPALVTVKGEGKIGGAQSTFEYRQPRGGENTEFRFAATLDDQTRARFGIELYPWLAGPVPVKASGRWTSRETRMDVDADLTAAKVSDLVPGWSKAPGRAARAIYRFVERDGRVRVEDLNVSGAGTSLRGVIELEPDGSLISANFPVFHLSDGDKAALRADRAADGTLKVTVRGDVLDARAAMRSLTEGSPSAPGRPFKPRDLDLDMRLGAATGNNGEVVRQLEFRLLRKSGEVRSFALLGRIGRDASLVGELRTRDGGGKPVLYVTAGDAGAFFRFADLYNRIQGGDVWLIIDPPNADGAPQDGIISVRDFVVRGESNLDRLQSATPRDEAGKPIRSAQGDQVPFSRLRVDFSRTPGRFGIREGVIFGPTIGATVDGSMDYAANRVSLRGTFVPAYGLNNLFARIPVVGFFLGGGPNEGVFAVPFEIVGPVNAPTLRVNPVAAAAPGFLRKIFEFRGASDAPPARPVP